MCTCKFLLPRWHWAARSISMSWVVALRTDGRLEGAILSKRIGRGAGNAVGLDVLR